MIGVGVFGQVIDKYLQNDLFRKKIGRGSREMIHQTFLEMLAKYIEIYCVLKKYSHILMQSINNQ